MVLPWTPLGGTGSIVRPCAVVFVSTSEWNSTRSACPCQVPGFGGFGASMAVSVEELPRALARHVPCAYLPCAGALCRACPAGRSTLELSTGDDATGTLPACQPLTPDPPAVPSNTQNITPPRTTMQPRITM